MSRWVLQVCVIISVFQVRVIRSVFQVRACRQTHDRSSNKCSVGLGWKPAGGVRACTGSWCSFPPLIVTGEGGGV